MTTAAEKFKQSKPARGASAVLTDWHEPKRTLSKEGQPAMRTRTPRAARPVRLHTYLTQEEGRLLEQLTAQIRIRENDKGIRNNIILGRAIKLLAQHEGL